jgi:hypothetical protein
LISILKSIKKVWAKMKKRKNKNKKGRQAENYIYIPALDDNGCVIKLLLTEREYAAAVKRASSNPEDTFGDVIAFQVINNQISQLIGTVEQNNFNQSGQSIG